MREHTEGRGGEGSTSLVAKWVESLSVKKKGKKGLREEVGRTLWTRGGARVVLTTKKKKRIEPDPFLQVKCLKAEPQLGAGGEPRGRCCGAVVGYEATGSDVMVVYKIPCVESQSLEQGSNTGA